jgi:hypothetical protein
VDVHDLLTANVQVDDLDSYYTGTTAMAIVPLPLPPGIEARALLHHLLEHGHIAGRGSAGGTIGHLEESVFEGWAEAPCGPNGSVAAVAGWMSG